MKRISDLWTKYYRNLRMRNKIIVSIYLILLPMVLVGSSVVFIWISRNKERETAQLYERFTQTICDNIDYMQQDVLDIADYFAVNADVHTVLSSRNVLNEDNGLFWTDTTPLSFLSNILAIKSQIKTVILYPENGLPPYYISRDASVHNTEISYIRELQIYEDIIESRGDVLWRRVDEGKNDIYLYNKSDKMVAYRMLFDLSKRRKLGVLAIGIEVERYENILENVLQYKNEGAIILDNQGQELITKGVIDEKTMEYLKNHAENLTEQQDVLGRMDAGDAYLFYGRDKKNNLQICYVTPKANWGIYQHGNLALPAVICFLLLVLSWPLSAIISGSLSKSTKTLLVSMEKFQHGDFSERVEVESRDEIGQLSMAFNQMAMDTQTLIEKNYIMTLKEREIELNALQAQINPHFLYNVLDSLYWEAIDAGSEKMGDDILALSELMRLLLSQGESEITVKKEIELISRYLQIQQMRFSRRFSYQVDVDENIQKYKISKLMLQPFVENAIVHGFEMKQESGYVRLFGTEKDGYMEFVIEDDGAGMDQEEADRLLEESKGEDYPDLRMGHYAIRNIKERLILRYGENYTLKITSQKGEGTKVYIAIPITH